MTRYGKERRAETRRAVVDAASRLMREQGVAAASVGAIMQSVGLTHGGFYAHFPDKSALMAEALRAAFVESPPNFTALAGMAKATGDVGVVATHYLADRRVAEVASGCPAAALVSEIGRCEAPMKAAFDAGAAETVAALSAAPGLGGPDDPRAWAALALLVGSLAMMRATEDPARRAGIRAGAEEGLRALAAGRA